MSDHTGSLSLMSRDRFLELLAAGLVIVATIDHGLWTAAHADLGPWQRMELMVLVVAVGATSIAGLIPQLFSMPGSRLVYGVLIASTVLLSVFQGGLSVFAGLLMVNIVWTGTRLVGFSIAVAMTLIAVALVVFMATFEPAWSIPPAPPGVEARLVISIVAFVALSLFGLTLRKTLVSILEARIARLEASVDELSAANMSYNTFVQMAESQAARHERSRITREIHDGVGYALTNLIMLAESAQDLMNHDPPAVIERLATIRNQARLALNDTRRALRELREAEQGLVRGERALEHMMDVFEKATGVQTAREFLVPSYILENQRVFPVAYRFVQEALTNSFRHGHATLVTVRAWFVDRELIISVADDGNAPAEIAEGIGLQGMRERLGEIGGELSYHSLNGFTVIARMPLPPDEASYA